MNRFERHANARSSTMLPCKPLNRLAMTEMNSTIGRFSAEKDSCNSLASVIQVAPSHFAPAKRPSCSVTYSTGSYRYKPPSAHISVRFREPFRASPTH
jgi:hypothetical protein